MFTVEILMISGEWKKAGRLQQWQGDAWIDPEFATHGEALAAAQKAYADLLSEASSSVRIVGAPLEYTITLDGSNQGLPKFENDEQVLKFWNDRYDVPRTGARSASLVKNGKQIDFRLFND